MSSELHFQTKAIHGASAPDRETGAILTPIYQSATFVQHEVGHEREYSYTRSDNPTVKSLELALGGLEGIPRAVAYATGMAALSSLFLSLLKAGDHIVCSASVYGGTLRVLRKVLEPLAIECSYCESTNPSAIADALQENTRLVFIETPSNPTLRLTDIAAVAARVHDHGALLAVDNTFLTSALQRPFELGADIVAYSTTKYIEGHNSTVGGALLAKCDEVTEKFLFNRNAIGFIQSPFDAWLTLRGLKTLPVRMKVHSENAQAIAEHLEGHDAVARVLYPGLESFKDSELAKRQHLGHGGMISFELKGGLEAGRALMENVKVCSLAESLGALETLITHPATMTQAEVPREERLRGGITDGLIRLSVGLENPSDIIQDLEQALRASGRE